MQEVLGRTSKMLIDQSQGGNSVMYLPLDKMIENSRNTRSFGNQNNSMFTDPSASGGSISSSQVNRTGTGSGRTASRSSTR
jgi:hypothetical protein